MNDRRIYVNGINALTGEYLVPPLTAADAAALARGKPPPPAEHVGLLRTVLTMIKNKFFALPSDVKAEDPAQAGWAVVFTPDTPDSVRKGMRPLLDLRAKQIPPDRYKVLEYKGESREDWLGKYGAHGADVEPTCVPYYVLLVGGPDAIPFDFQFLLDINYAVGRLAFDRPEDYGRYAQAVMDYETGARVPNAREVVYWGTRHDADAATQLSADTLITPLAEGLPAAGTAAAQPAPAAKFKFRSRCFKADDATKANLLEVLHARKQPPPALLFTASHGMGGWPVGDPRQRPGQGALLCQDWPGFGRIKPEHYLTAAEVEPDARLQGVMAFVFACYGAGTPRYDPYLTRPAGGPVEVAAAPFVSALGQRLLAGGALAVIGHIERAWGYSLEAQGVGPQLLPFRNLIQRLLAGTPAGHSTVDFSGRYATYSTELLQKLDPSLPASKRPTDAELAWDWVERNDAQNYIVLGDPAVCLRADDLE